MKRYLLLIMGLLLLFNLAYAQGPTCRSRTTATNVLYQNTGGSPGSPMVISALSITSTGTSTPALTFRNCHDIDVYDCIIAGNATLKLKNDTLRGDPAQVNRHGIDIENSYNIHIHRCRISLGAALIYVNLCTGGIKIDSNELINPTGPFPRGQGVQVLHNTTVNGPTVIKDNRYVAIYGQSDPEDAINLYEDVGSAANPYIVASNWITGGGPSVTGSAITIDDGTGSPSSYQYVYNNIVRNSGHVGIQTAGGTHSSIKNNIIYSKYFPWSGVGLGSNNYTNLLASNDTITGNTVRWQGSGNFPRDTVWRGQNAGYVTNNPQPFGWKTGNTLRANIDSTILPISYISSCIVPVVATVPKVVSYNRADTAYFTNTGKNAQVVMQIATKDTVGGFAENMGGGRIEFHKVPAGVSPGNNYVKTNNVSSPQFADFFLQGQGAFIDGGFESTIYGQGFSENNPTGDAVVLNYSGINFTNANGDSMYGVGFGTDSTANISAKKGLVIDNVYNDPDAGPIDTRLVVKSNTGGASLSTNGVGLSTGTIGNGDPTGTAFFGLTSLQGLYTHHAYSPFVPGMVVLDDFDDIGLIGSKPFNHAKMYAASYVQYGYMRAYADSAAKAKADSVKGTISGGASGAAGGDLSGTYPNPTVAKFNGQLPAYYLNYAHLTGTPVNLSQFVNDVGFLTSLTSSQIISALGYTPYNGATNPNGYISSITGSMINSALGYTPYDGSGNPNGFLTGITSGQINTALGYTPYNGTANSLGFATLVSPSFTTPSLGDATANSITVPSLTASAIVATNTVGKFTTMATTGSGNVVKAISPTLTTPNLGVPSAITLTNATGLPLPTAVTGVLPGANGGTGVANTGKTITLGGNLSTTGAFTTNFNVSANTSVSLPTAGTLATTGGTETFTAKSIDGGSNTLTNISNSSLSNSGDNGLAALQYLGSAGKGFTVGATVYPTNNPVALTNQQIVYTAVYLPVGATITGVKLWCRINGSYTATGANGVASYSINVSTGLLTQEAASTSSTTVWQTGTGVVVVPFSSPVAMSAGVHYIAVLYQRSAETTAPQLLAIQPSAIANAYDFAHSITLFGITSSQTAFPSTQAMSGITSNNVGFYCELY